MYSEVLGAIVWYMSWFLENFPATISSVPFSLLPVRLWTRVVEEVCSCFLPLGALLLFSPFSPHAHVYFSQPVLPFTDSYLTSVVFLDESVKGFLHLCFIFLFPAFPFYSVLWLLSGCWNPLHIHECCLLPFPLEYSIY